jgi:hypothetical protein
MSEERTPGPSTTTGIEVELVQETRTAPFHDATWRMLEIWTQNSLYAIDPQMRCFDVIDRSSLRPVNDHALLGARLVGGQLQTAGGIELAHPFPLPGMEAVFERILRGGAASFSYSSAVQRVVLRQRRVRVEGATTSLWGEIQASPSTMAPSGPGPSSVRPPAASAPSIKPAPVPSLDPDDFDR